MDDEQLIAAIAGGDSTALREIFDRHAGWLAGRLRTALPAHAVEDVLQETFLAVWRGAHRYGKTGAPAAWLWGIARRQAALWARKHQRGGQLLDLPPDINEARDYADEAATRVDLDSAMDSLGEAGSPARRLAHLAFVEDRPVREIAERLAIPEGTVKSRVHTLRRRLKAALTREEGAK